MQRVGGCAVLPTVTAEITLLADEEAELTIRQNLFLASVLLIEDVGGGWDTNLLPTMTEMQKDFSLLPQLPANRSGVWLPPPADAVTH